jgi:hypothetical protein
MVRTLAMDFLLWAAFASFQLSGYWREKVRAIEASNIKPVLDQQVFKLEDLKE